MKITPALKGAITAVLMIAVILVIVNLGKEANPRLQYIVYLIYGLGIFWAIAAYRSSAAFTGKFGDLFGQGFRCFIVVTLAMAVFYAVFNYLNPSFAEESTRAFQEQLEQQVRDKKILSTDIESEVSTFKKQYTLKLVSGAIFGYLIIGAGVTAVISILSLKRK